MTPGQQRSARTAAQLRLLGGFSLTVGGRRVSLPIHGQRVLAYLSVVPGQPAHPRSSLAERLWSEVTTERAQASLRTALWRIGQADRSLIWASRDRVGLGEAVDVDLRRGTAQAARLLADGRDLEPGDEDLAALRGHLLPDWEEDWLLLERERISQLQLHALEALSGRLRRLGRYVEAIEAAYAAIAGEPLRESAHAALIDVFLAEQNVAQAHRHLDQYAALLRGELGIRPSAGLTARVLAAGGQAGDQSPAATDSDPPTPNRVIRAATRPEVMASATKACR
jgi:DNA-binding SARP family transcriptional activator